ncbi:IS630 family transposase [Aliifodinibius sp. S!AR15-10]|uniref:IS630 family transposase n=1 Tax=Aliifodinibius sp. S!AR15-10 TaxID=2950437 RepID=UPI002857AB07|nr:IS630 family transposase [Aliifodinibius sp. S!AR15-10]MDR8394684.1 IS630 family transposase [Aliifodinibius sp. S!AR15-10]
MDKLTFPDLSQQVKDQLLTYGRSHKVERRLNLRAQIILDWKNGLTYRASSEKHGVGENVIGKWRKRFASEGLAGLADARRSGRPAQFTEADRNKVIHLACQRTESDTQRYSQHEIADMCGMSQSWVSEILRGADLKPHKTEYWCGRSPDPEFESKMIDIIGLYLNPPENALVLSVDEKTQIQALDRTQPELPLRKGNPRRVTNTYKRNGTVNLMAALAVQTGEVTARQADRNNSENFLKFLKHLDRKYRNVQIHIIMDNLSTHKNKQVTQWLDKKRKFHVHFTPTYASWLNQIEIWFSIMSRKILKDGVWHSRQQLVDQLMSYIKDYNQKNAKPFNWTYGKEYLTN